jgi:hypothetical protein
MAIVFPSESVARRWDGALQARLRRAPLEAFLQSRSLALAPAGLAQDSDDLARATVLVVESGLLLYFADRAEGLSFAQRAIVGHVTCLVSRGLAELISQPNAWRVVALVSTARLLSPWIGLNAAAMTAASAARQFRQSFTGSLSILDQRVIESAGAAVIGSGANSWTEMSASIAARLAIETSSDLVCAAKESLQNLS